MKVFNLARVGVSKMVSLSNFQYLCLWGVSTKDPASLSPSLCARDSRGWRARLNTMKGASEALPSFTRSCFSWNILYTCNHS